MRTGSGAPDGSRHAVKSTPHEHLERGRGSGDGVVALSRALGPRR